MDLNRYPGNSNASRIQRSKDPVEKAVDIPEGRTIKKTKMAKFASNLFAEDITNVKEYVIWDVILPAVKNTISDIVCNGIDMILFGQTSSGRRSGGKVNYSGIYSGGLKSSRVINLNEKREEERVRRSGTSGYAYQEIALSRPEADDVLYILRQKEEQYGLTSVSDMYDAIEEVIGEKVFTNVREFTDNQWGWSDLSRARYDKVGNGVVLRMPRIEPL